jgi:hypothetical protein
VRDSGARDSTAQDRGAREAGVRVLVGGCLELGADGLPFAPFTAVLRAAWDAAAGAWATVRQPHPEAWALTAAAPAAMADGDRDGAATRLRRAATLAAGLSAAPLSDQIALLSRCVLRPVGDWPAQARGVVRGQPRAAERAARPRLSA